MAWPSWQSLSTSQLRNEHPGNLEELRRNPDTNSTEPREEGCSYRPISLLCLAVKILERLILPVIVETLGTCPSQHGFKPRHSTASVLLPISATVVSGFNQRKPPSRTTAITVDISKAFDTVSHHLLIEMIHRSRLCHNLVRWLVAYLHGRKASCLYQQHHSPSHQVWTGVPQGSTISPALFNHFVSDCPIPDLDMTSYADFTLLAWGDDPVASLNRNPKILGVTLEVIQNKTLRIATGCHQKATVSHLRAESGFLPLRMHLELCCQQFYASAL